MQEQLAVVTKPIKYSLKDKRKTLVTYLTQLVVEESVPEVSKLNKKR